MARDSDWYDSASHYWSQIPEASYLTPDETREIYPVFLDFLADTMNGLDPHQSLAWNDLLDYFGWNEGTFDWEDFRDWYDAL